VVNDEERVNRKLKKKKYLIWIKLTKARLKRLIKKTATLIRLSETVLQTEESGPATSK